jgi:hypothetical protein
MTVAIVADVPLLPLERRDPSCGFWRYRMAKLKVLEEYRRDVVAHRADEENELFHEGDPRGTHGRYPPPTEEDSK